MDPAFGQSGTFTLAFFLLGSVSIASAVLLAGASVFLWRPIAALPLKNLVCAGCLSAILALVSLLTAHRAWVLVSDSLIRLTHAPEFLVYSIVGALAPVAVTMVVIGLANLRHTVRLSRGNA